jgi:ABC-type uncharacterized transport system substrate-binding protein
MRRREFIGLTALGPVLLSPARSQAGMKRVAIVAAALPTNEVRTHPYYKSFIDELTRLGFVEGSNLTIEVYSGQGEKATYGALAERVVASRPHAIMTTSGPLSREFKAATTTIPVVAVVADPIAIGLTSSMARPDANLTGVTVDGGVEINGKRLALLLEARPSISRVGYLTSSRAWKSVYGDVMGALARRSKVSLTAIELGDVVNEAAYADAFRNLKSSSIDALLVSDEPDHVVHSKLLISLIADAKLPAMHPFRDIVLTGGLMAYSVDLPAVYRYAAGQMAEILRGASPTQVPFYQPTKFHFVVNTKAARTIGLELSPMLLAQADEVIE